MSLFPFKSRASVRRAWSFTPGGMLWRILPTPAGGFVGESRDAEKLQVRFFHVDAREGKVWWRDKSWSEPWWTGLEAICGSVVILHEYTKPDLPDHARIHAVDLQTGDLLWSAPDMTYSFALGDRIFAVRMAVDKRTDVALDARTGGVMEEYEAESGLLRKLRDTAGRESAADLLQFPEPNLGGEASGGEVIAGPGWRVVSVYEPVSGTHPPEFRQRLTVGDGTGRTLLTEVIHEKARAIVPDTFFSWDGMLYYLKNQRTLTAVSLPQET